MNIPTLTLDSTKSGDLLGAGLRVSKSTIINDVSTLDWFASGLASGDGQLAIDIETCARNEWRLRDKEAALNPWRGRVSLITLEVGGVVTVIDALAFHNPRQALAQLGGIVQHRGVIGHNLLFDLTYLNHCLGWPLPDADKITDTLVLEAILTAGAQVKPANSTQPDSRVPVSKSLETAMARHLDIHLDKSEQVSDWGRRPLSEAQVTYAKSDVQYLRLLAEAQWSAIKMFNLERVANLDLSCIPVLVKAMVHGVPLDLQGLTAAQRKLTIQLGEREQHLRVLLVAPKLSLEPADDSEESNEGQLLNPRSVPQLKAALARKLGCPILETNRSYLIRILRPRAPKLIDALLAWRQTASLLQFAKKLQATCEADGRIHPQFRSETDTGRITSSRPNLQGLPRGEVVRACIACPPGRVFVGSDYPQIELRLAGWIFGEPAIKNVYLREAEMRARGESKEAIERECDIHLLTAAKLNGKPPGDVTKPERTTAKSASFGVLYGMGGVTLSERAKVQFGVNLTEQEAKRIIQQWLMAHPVIRSARDQLFRQNKSRVLKECRTVFGRRRLLEPGHQASTRYAINSPIQGASADVTRLAMVKVSHVLPATATLVLTIHDELLIECDAADAEAVKAILTRAMEEAVHDLFPDMPCTVEAKAGLTWAAVK